MPIRTRLKEIRGAQKVTQAQIAKVLNMSERTIRKYESGEIEPTEGVLITLADYFNVSLDYLVGRSDDPTRR